MTVSRDGDARPVPCDAVPVAAFDHAAHNHATSVAAGPGHHAPRCRPARGRGALPSGARLRVLAMGRTTGPSTAALRAGVAGAAPASGGCRWAVVLGDRRHVLRAPQVGPAVREYPLSGRPAHRAVCAAGCRALLQRVAPAPGDSAPSRRLWRDGVDVGTVDPCAARSRPRAFGRARALPLPGRRTGIAHAVAGRRAGSAHRAPR